MMDTVYHLDDDILVIRLSDEPLIRETSHGWNVNTSYTASGAITEIVILEAKEKGLFPVATEKVVAESLGRRPAWRPQSPIFAAIIFSAFIAFSHVGRSLNL